MADESLVLQLLRERIVFLSTPIDDDAANQVMAGLLFLESEDPDQGVSLHINSPGGSATATLAVLDTIRSLRTPVSTVCLGRAAAGAALLLAAGVKGKRFALPNASISLHPLSGSRQEPRIDLTTQVREIQRVTITFQEAFAACTGRSVAEVAEAMSHDTFFSPQEAREFGLIDALFERRPDRTGRR